MNDISPVPRPNPLSDAASKVGTAWSAAAAVVAYLVTSGALTLAQGEAIVAAGEAAPEIITQVGGVVAGLIALGGGIVSAFRSTGAAKDQVTPIRDPRNDAGQALTPDAVVTVSTGKGGSVGPTSSGPTVGDTWTS